KSVLQRRIEHERHAYMQRLIDAEKAQEEQRKLERLTFLTGRIAELREMIRTEYHGKVLRKAVEKGEKEITKLAKQLQVSIWPRLPETEEEDADKRPPTLSRR